MDPDRWRVIESLYAAVMKLDGAARSGILAVAHEKDPELCHEVRSLLRYADRDHPVLPYAIRPEEACVATRLSVLPELSVRIRHAFGSGLTLESPAALRSYATGTSCGTPDSFFRFRKGIMARSSAPTFSTG